MDELNEVAKRLLIEYTDYEKDMDYIVKQIRNKKYSILPDTIAQGTVYKIPFEGNLQEDGFEKGFLYLPVGSAIKQHTHTNDVEQYLLMVGTLSVKGQIETVNRCLLAESHNIDVVTTPTVVRTLKISKELLEKELNKNNEKSNQPKPILN